MSAHENDKDVEAAIPLMDEVDAAIKAHDDEKGAEALPEPATASTPSSTASKYSLSAAVIIPIWMCLSASVILYNNYVFNTLEFKYPVFLVTWHLIFSTIGTRVLQRTTRLVDGAKDIKLSLRMFLTSILPIGILFSGSLILSNKAYLHLSVPFIQMLKAFNPVAILLISWTFRIQDPNRKLFMIVSLISCGVALASYGEVKFDLVGFVTQALAVAFEASRLVMIEILLHNIKMDPLVSLHYYAPVCAVINLFILPFTEGRAPFDALASIGPWHLILLSNALIAFGLNVAAVFLIKAGSGLVLTLAGVLKDILLISASVVIFGAPIYPLQVLGYSVALGGLILFKTNK